MAEESISLSNVVEFGIVAMQELLEFHQEEVEGSCRSFVTFIQWILTRSITERAKVAEVIQKSRELLDLITAWLMHSSAGLVRSSDLTDSEKNLTERVYFVGTSKWLNFHKH